VGVLERDLGETVFRDLHVTARQLHLLAQILHLGDGEAVIVSHHHDVRGLEDSAQFGDGLSFCRSIHCKALSGWRLARMIRGSRRVATGRPASGCTRSNPGRTTFELACPPRAAEAAIGYPRFEPTWRVHDRRSCFAQTRVSSPSVLALCRIKRVRPAPAVLDRSVGPFPVRPCAPFKAMKSVLPFQMSRRDAQKE